MYKIIGLIVAALYLFVKSASHPVPAPSPTPTAQSGYRSEIATVSAVIDGDTIVLADGKKLRYIGIDTPETKHPVKGVQCFGKEASEKNKQLVDGKTIRIERDVSDTDRYGRLLRYVWVNDVFVNDELVLTGYAYAATFPPDVKYASLFKTSAATAREKNVGLWNACK